MALSLRPSTFSAGGLIDDIDVEIVRARFVQYDFEGKSDEPKLCILGVMKDNDGNEHPQYWSAGDLQFFVPSEDPKNEDLNGITCVQVGQKTALNGGTNAALFLNSLVQVGFPEDQLDAGDLRVLEGVKVHVNRVPQPKRNNLPKKTGQSDRDPMVLIATALIAMPGESKPAAATKTAAKTATTGKPIGVAAAAKSGTARTASPSNELDMALVEELGGELMGLFASKEVQSMKKVELTKGLFSSIDKTNTNKTKMIGMAARDEVLKAIDGFTFDGSMLSIG